MSPEWLVLVRRLCTPGQELAVARIAAAGSGEGETSTTADAAELARRFGLSSGEADVWARGAVAATVLSWPSSALDLLAPVGLFGEIGLDDTVAVVERLAAAGGVVAR